MVEVSALLSSAAAAAEGLVLGLGLDDASFRPRIERPTAGVERPERTCAHGGSNADAERRESTVASARPSAAMEDRDTGDAMQDTGFNYEHRRITAYHAFTECEARSSRQEP